MPDEPIVPGQLPNDDDFYERFGKAQEELEGVELGSIPGDDEIAERLRKAANAGTEIEGFELSDEELEARTARLQAEVHKAMSDGLPDVPDFDDRLDKVSEAKQRHERKIEETDRQRALDAKSARGLGVGLSIAYTIIGVPLAGAALGWYIDSRMGTDLWKGLLTLLGAVIGIGYTVLAMNRQNDRQ